MFHLIEGSLLHVGGDLLFERLRQRVEEVVLVRHLLLNRVVRRLRLRVVQLAAAGFGPHSHQHRLPLGRQRLLPLAQEQPPPLGAGDDGLVGQR